MTSLYPIATIRQIEQAALHDLPSFTLMQRAGRAAADSALRLLPHRPHDGAILVLAGPGDNGGDALETATNLVRAGADVVVMLWADPAHLSRHATNALKQAQQHDVHLMPREQFADIDHGPWILVIDGLFGIGLKRALDDELRHLVLTINTLNCPILALDVPSGLDADTGMLIGPNGIAIQADHTITFIADKIGLHTCDGPDYAGQVEVARLGLAETYFPAAHAWLNSPALFADNLRPRRRNSHKGHFGDVAIIGGAEGLSGAPILAARAAIKSGAGRVFAGFIDASPLYDSDQPELMCRHATALDLSSSVLVIGPGLGVSDAAQTLLIKALDTPSLLVLDADALNLVAYEPALQQKISRRQHTVIMTPHPLEAARLLGLSTSAIQADRATAARALAQRLNVVVILKGAGTIIARADNAIVINTNGNPALATAGSGDILSGICGALLAQGWPQWQAALGAVWLHGRAADHLVNQGMGPIGLSASELIPAVRLLLNQLVQDSATTWNMPLVDTTFMEYVR